MKAIFSKKGKKIEGDSPEKYNTLYTFNHESIIKDSKNTDHPLFGCESSNTLFIETEIDKSSSGLIFTENYGNEIMKAIKSQVKEEFPSSLLISHSNISRDLSISIPFIETPSLELIENTFSRGITWYEENHEKITQELNKEFRNTSLIFIFVENNAFIVGLITKIAEYIKGKNIQPILCFHIPPQGQSVVQEFTVLTAIHKLMKESTITRVPFILYDENNLLKANPNTPIDILKSKLYEREAHIIYDIILASQAPSEFYHIDSSNLLRIFTETKGLCKVFSVDIYDNNPILSNLVANNKYAWSFKSDKKSTRGFLVIQPGSQGLQTKDYKLIRKEYSNLDVIFSILPKRMKGAFIRGIFTYNLLPKEILEKFDLFSSIQVEIFDDNKERTGFFDFSDLDEIWMFKNYLVKSLTEIEES